MKKITYLLSLSALLITGQLFGQENNISENGNVGIGTGSATPSARLQVAGSTRIDSTLTVNDSVVMASSARVGADLKVDGDLYLPNISTVDHLTSETILVSGENGITKKLAFATLRDIFYSRNCDLVGGVVNSPSWANGPNKLFSECPQVLVGVGTANPTKQLDVVGEAKVSGNLWAQGSISIGSDLNTFSKLSITNPNRTAAIQVKTAGNTQPFQRLMYFEYNYADTKILEVENTTTGIKPFVLHANGAMDIHNGTDRIFHLGTEGSLELKSGGLQTFKVETNGLIRGRRLKLDLNTWSDYVFEPTYKLMPLNEVEAFVKKEKHLPNVPSEKEFIANGADVMEMNKIFMEKIEELTLYLIQQNKNTEELKKQIEELQAKLKSLENRQ